MEDNNVAEFENIDMVLRIDMKYCVPNAAQIWGRLSGQVEFSICAFLDLEN